MSKIIGVTGGIGAGKSSILDFMKKEYDAEIIIADEVGRELMRAGTECFDRIVEAFGGSVLDSSGELDREKLSGRIFGNQIERELLDGIVHPRVKKEIYKRIEEIREKDIDNTKLIVIEAALLIEEHYEGVCDELWFIYSPKELRLKRLTETRGYSVEKSLSIMNNQLTDEEMRKACQVTIDNSIDFDYTVRQVSREYNRIMGTD